MATGYTRVSSTKSDGDTILTSDWNGEFNGLQAAFDTVAGHNHDGSAGGGALISLSASVTGTLNVSKGGTGRTSLTTNGVLYGKGTGGVDATAVANNAGEVLIANGSLVPTFGAVDLGNGSATSGQLPVANGGTGASNQADARSNLSVDDIATKKSNLSATSAPTATNDGSEGYGAGSFWIDTSTNDIYMCADPTNAAAVWKQISNV